MGETCETLPAGILRFAFLHRTRSLTRTPTHGTQGPNANAALGKFSERPATPPMALRSLPCSALRETESEDANRHEALARAPVRGPLQQDRWRSIMPRWLSALDILYNARHIRWGSPALS